MDEPRTRAYASVSVFPVVPFWLSGISHLSVLLSAHPRFTNPNFCLHSCHVTKGWAGAKDFKNGSKEGSPGKPAAFRSPPLEKLKRKKTIILFVLVSCAIMFPYFSLQITLGKYFSAEPLKALMPVAFLIRCLKETDSEDQCPVDWWSFYSRFKGSGPQETPALHIFSWIWHLTQQVFLSEFLGSPVVKQTEGESTRTSQKDVDTEPQKQDPVERTSCDVESARQVLGARVKRLGPITGTL